jgi:20S proteasome alpha/beta subunit
MARRFRPGKKSMTVCIAAVCGATHDDGPFVITAADRMITIGDLEYEPNQTKTIYLATQTVALVAGDMQLHAAVAPRVNARIKDYTSDHGGTITVSAIAEFYAEEFGYHRRVMAEREILVPRGLSFDRFLSRQATMSQHQVSEIDNRLASYCIESSAIIAGIDETGGHIWVVENPGIANCYDTPYFACIGSGASLAEAQFMVKGFDKTWSLPQSIWLAYEAKARAESAGGVGHQSDLIIIARGGKRVPLGDTDKDMLWKLFQNVSEKERELAAQCGAAIEEYIRKQTRQDGSESMQHTATSEDAQQEAAKRNGVKRADAPKKRRKKP